MRYCCQSCVAHVCMCLLCKGRYYSTTPTTKKTPITFHSQPWNLDIRGMAGRPGSLRGDIPHLFQKFEGRDKKQWGKKIFGEAYANWPVPMKGSGDDEGAPHGGPCAVSAPRLELLFNHTIH